MKNVPSFILSILIFACSTNSANDLTTDTTITTPEQIAAASEPSEESERVGTAELKPVDADFAKFLELIPELDLPYQTSCDNSYPDYPEVPKELIEKYTKWYLYHPYRKITTNRNFQLVLHLAPADYELPILYTFTNNGDSISTKQMFFGYCGGEPGYFHKEHFRIDEQLNIVHFDSTWRHEVDEDYNEIEGTETLKAVTTIFTLTANGEFVELEN